MFTLRSPLQLPNLVGPQTNHKPADCGTVKFICKNTSHLIRGQSKEKTSCYFCTALMLIVRTLLKGFSRYRLPPLFEEPLHHNGSHCKLLRGASIVWDLISLSASPGSRHDLKVMPTLRPRNIKMDFSNTDIDLKSQVRHDPKVMPTLRLLCNLKTNSSLLMLNLMFHSCIWIVVILLYIVHTIVHICKDFPRKVPNLKPWTIL